ncbi:MAG: hypothetical protein H0X40_00440 [Chthoniobacterales bacterium]|nr:hypothetical protein [Chthoniobacterales bacterium]
MNYLLIFLLTWYQPQGWFHHKPRPTPTPAPTPTATPRHRPRHSASESSTPASSLTKAPRGIFYLLKTDEPISEKQSCWTNPAINGVRLSVSIGSIEKRKGDFDWAQLDTAAALAKAKGKQWSVGVAWAPALPAWVGAKMYKFSTAAAALPWDPALVAAELDFIEAFGKHFAGDSNLAGVIVGGLGTGADGFVTTVAKDADDIAALGSGGGAPEWIAASQKIIGAYAAAFPHHAIMLVAANPFPNEYKSLATIGDWATSAYPDFGVIAPNLKMTSGVDDTPTALVNVYALSHPCGFQLASTDLGGTMPQVLGVGVKLLRGRGDIEVSGSACDDAANAEALTAATRQLKAGALPNEKSKEKE